MEDKKQRLPACALVFPLATPPRHGKIWITYLHLPSFLPSTTCKNDPMLIPSTSTLSPKSLNVGLSTGTIRVPGMTITEDSLTCHATAAIIYCLYLLPRSFFDEPQTEKGCTGGTQAI